MGTADWLVPLIAGVSGVGGAAVGAGAILIVQRREAAERREQERRSALVAFYAATNGFALLYDTWAKLRPKGWFADVRVGIRTLGFQGLIVQRLFHVSDQFWDASGRARAVASADELAAIDGVELVIADWQIGEPMPEGWAPAIRRLRALLERAEA